MRRLSKKELGEAAEARFLDVALFLGFIVAKLWGDSRPFDFYVASEVNSSPYRIQVKATRSPKGTGWKVNTQHTQSGRPYTAEEIDFIAAFVEPTGTWYIVPAHEVVRTTSFTVYPHSTRSRSKYERYREQWDLLRR